MAFTMFSEQIELRGHIIDSLILPKVLDEILTHGGSFTIREITIGKQRHDASYACIDVFGPSPQVVDGNNQIRESNPSIVDRIGPEIAFQHAFYGQNSFPRGSIR